MPTHVPYVTATVVLATFKTDLPFTTASWGHLHIELGKMLGDDVTAIGHPSDFSLRNHLPAEVAECMGAHNVCTTDSTDSTTYQQEISGPPKMKLNEIDNLITRALQNDRFSG